MEAKSDCGLLRIKTYVSKKGKPYNITFVNNQHCFVNIYNGYKGQFLKCVSRVNNSVYYRYDGEYIIINNVVFIGDSKKGLFNLQNLEK